MTFIFGFPVSTTITATPIGRSYLTQGAHSWRAFVMEVHALALPASSSETLGVSSRFFRVCVYGTELLCICWVAFGQCAAVPLARIAPLHHCRRRGTTSNRSESYKTKRRVRERDKDRRESEKEARTDTIFANNRTRGFPHAVYSTIGCGPFTRCNGMGDILQK